MGMIKAAVYREICARLVKSGDVNMDVEAVASEYDGRVAAETVDGIYRRLVQTLSRRRIWRFEAMKIPAGELLQTFWSRWGAAARDSIVEEMARELCNVPPCFLARLLLRAFAEAAAPRAKVSCNLDDLDGEVDGGAAALRVSPARLYKEPALIAHEGLARNIQQCHAVDEHYSPAMDEYRNRIGREYEERLAACLGALQIAHLDEPGMRRMGYARTPDAVLLEPIAVDGGVVKWIESKAWFGDPSSHATYLRDQYWPYYNRFGPGLVIYWFGFVEEAADPHQTRGVAVLAGFPDAARITRVRSPMAPLVERAAPDAHGPGE